MEETSKLVVASCDNVMLTDEQLMSLYPQALSADEASRYYWEDYQDCSMDAANVAPGTMCPPWGHPSLNDLPMSQKEWDSLAR